MVVTSSRRGTIYWSTLGSPVVNRAQPGVLRQRTQRKFQIMKELDKFLTRLTVPLREYVNMRDRPRRVDVLSRFLFPIAFFVFNILYWYKFQP